MAYVPNAADVTQPTEDKNVETAALEFRTLKASVKRSLKFPASDAASYQGELPAAALRAGKFLYFNSVTAVPEAVPGTPAAPTTSDLVGFIQSGTGAVARTAQDKMRESVSVKDFGASASATAAANLAAFKAAVVAVAPGGKLIVPVDSSFYSIDTSGGLSTAIEINKRMEVVFEGDVKANYGTMQANPPYIFKVTAVGVTFSGSGRIIGNGTIDDTNAGTDDTFPGLVYVNADNFTMQGVVVDTPPKVGVMLYNCKNAKIIGNTFTGGPTTYSDTAHFAIRTLLGEGHLISSNSFVPSANGGMFVNCIFAAGTNDSIISNNVCIRPYEKLAYIYGNKNLITGNAVKGNESTIPGSNHPGTITSVYRVNGSHNKITNNYSDYCIAGATAMDGGGNEISGNTFYRCGQAGITVFAGAGYTGGFSNTTVKHNICEASAMPNVGLGDGVLVRVDGAESVGIDISGNRLYGFAPTAANAGINLGAVPPFALRRSTVRGNIVYGGTQGVFLSRLTSSSISDNYVDSTSVQGFTDTGGAFNQWTNNRGRDAQVGISGLSSSSHGSGNQYTDANLSSVATLAAAASTTVMHGGVAPNARVFLQEANGPAGVLTSVTGMVTSVSGTNFVIATGNGGGANGTESFHYNIVQ
jgi:hypothetical protein